MLPFVRVDYIKIYTKASRRMELYQANIYRDKNGKEAVFYDGDYYFIRNNKVMSSIKSRAI